MLILETNASNEKEAAESSARYLQIESNQIAVQMARKGSSGFLGFGSKKPALFQIMAIKEVTPQQAVIRGVLSTILHKMGYKVENIQVSPADENGKVYVDIVSSHAGYIIGKYGRSLESLQFVVNLLVQSFSGMAPKILLDIENYRQRRANHLSNLALRVAESVTKSGKSRLLDPLNPYERRLIHVALQENENIETVSEGNGVYKRVRIYRKGNKTRAKYNDESVSVDDEIGLQSDPFTTEKPEVNGNIAENHEDTNEDEPDFNSKEYFEKQGFSADDVDSFR